MGKCHIDAYNWRKCHISMAWCKTAVTPVCWKWSYCSLALSHRCPYIYVNNCGLVTPYRRLSHMRVSLAACRKPAGSYTDCSRCYMFLDIKRNIFQSMIPIPPLWYFDTSVICPHRYRRIKFVIIPPMFCIAAILSHLMGTFSALLAIYAGNLQVTGEYPAQRPATRSFDFFFDLAWTNRWVSNRDVGDLRCHWAHYDVTVVVK